MLLTLLLVACAVFRLSLAAGQTVQTELQESVVQDLLKCINALSNDYKLYVSAEGYVVVIPAEQRTIDLMGIDEGLRKCMQLVLSDMWVIAESTEFEDAIHQSALATGSVDFAFLLENGAKGQGTQPGVDGGADVKATTLVDRSKHQLTKRCASYYGAYLSIFTGCASSDYITNYFGSCISYMSPYYSVQFYNPDVCNTMLVTIWPHHDCGQGNQQAALVGPQTTSSCNTRTTYSYTANPVTR